MQLYAFPTPESCSYFDLDLVLFLFFMFAMKSKVLIFADSAKGLNIAVNNSQI